jgi:hypothetical protein
MTAVRADDDSTGRFVRPYTLVSGRTRSRGNEQLPLETLVVAEADGPRLAALGPAQRRIGMLCTTPLSIAEISGRLDLPLGVVRVVVGDMAVDGLVEIHRPAATESEAPDLQLLERVLNGLESL